MLYILIIFALSALGALGDSFIKLAGQSTRADPVWLTLGTSLYLLSVPGWLLVMRHVPLTAVGALYAASSVLILTSIGLIAFHEHLSPTEIVGIVFALTAVVVLRRLL